MTLYSILCNGDVRNVASDLRKWGTKNIEEEENIVDILTKFVKRAHFFRVSIILIASENKCWVIYQNISREFFLFDISKNRT